MNRYLAVGIVVAVSLGGFLLGRLTARVEVFSANEWGTVADWVGGVGTAAAVVFAGYQLASDRAREKLRQAHIRTAAAAAVVVTKLNVRSDGLVVGQVSNGGSLPVFQCVVTAFQGDTPIKIRVGTVAAGATHDFEGHVRGVRPGVEFSRLAVRFLDSLGGVWESSEATLRMIKDVARGDVPGVFADSVDA